MNSTAIFKSFIAKNADWEEKHEVYQRDDSVYKRIVCRWKESKNLQHEYHACINTQTGEIYTDCRKRKIFAKHITLALFRPIHTIVKTLWHLSIIAPLSLEIYKVIAESQTKEVLWTNTVKSLQDIFRTPAYGIAITITHLAGVVFGCISPSTLYKTREIAGKLERDLLRVSYIFNGGIWKVAPCFSPVATITKRKNDTLVEPTEKELKLKLKKFAKNIITFLRENPNLFNNCFMLLPDDERYISSASLKNRN